MAERSTAADPPRSTFWGKTKEEYMAIRHSLPRGLELYDAVSAPRILSDEKLLESTYDLSCSDLRTDLSCPICMGILKRTVVVKDCLHRFCADCMEKCVRMGMRECPQCRIHVASRRSLRSDPLFDNLIRRLFQDVKAFEDKSGTLLAEANKRLSIRLEEEQRPNDGDSAHSRSASPGRIGDSPSNRFGAYIRADGVTEYRKSVTSSAMNDASLQLEQKLSKTERRRKRKEIEAQLRKIPTDGLLHFELVPDPSLPNLEQIKDEKNKLATDGLFTVQQLGRYLAATLGLQEESPLRIYTKDHRLPFDSFLSLAHVHHRSCGLSHETIVLYYTTRAADDASGGALKGTRGYISLPRNDSPKQSSAVENVAANAS